MNTRKIYTGLAKNKVTKNSFEDVYAADSLLLRPPLKRKTFVVVNLDPSWKEGSHWVAMMINPKGRCEYFDSYGKKPPYSEFEHILNKKYSHNNQQLQNPYTTCCGQWTMLYIWERCRGVSLKQFIKKFNKKDYLLNDHMVNQAVKKIFKTKSKVINKKFLCEQMCKSMNDNTCLHKNKCKFKKK